MASDEPDTAVIDAAIGDAPADAADSPAETSGDPGEFAQDDIDAMFATAAAEKPPKPSPAAKPKPVALSSDATNIGQDDIDALFPQVAAEAAPSSSPATASPPTTEEALNKMAGDEVDKLLADAEAQRSPAEPVAAPVPASAPVAAPPSDPIDEAKLAAELDALIESAESKTTTIADADADAVAAAGPAASSPAPSSHAVDEAQLAAQLDDLISGAQGDPSTVAAGSAPETESTSEQNGVAGTKPADAPDTAEISKQKGAEAEAAAAAQEEDRLKILAKELEVDKSELVNSELSSKGLAHPPAPAKAAPLRFDGKVSPLVRLLLMINSPVDACPDSLRNLMGKAAVVTFINATGILVYLAVRKHH